MPVQITPKADFVVVEFGSDLSIFAVSEVYQAVQKVPEMPAEKVILDLSAVNDLDSSGVQLLLWLVQAMPDKSISWADGDNPVVQRIQQLYNLNFVTE